MAPSHRRGPWVPEEDQLLLQLVREQGPNNWVRISQHMHYRSPKQCRERFHQNLKPSLNREPISADEGLMIERMVNEMGKRWAEIARRLGNRSDNAVKNWWNGSMNRKRRGLSTPPASRTFNGRIDLAPPVIDLTAQGFTLIGGRLDYIDGKPAAALVYRRRVHVINLFVAQGLGEAPSTPRLTMMQGFNLLRWNENGLNMLAVSDLNREELEEFGAKFSAAARAAAQS